MLLPQNLTKAAYLEVRRDEARWWPAIEVIAARHGIETASLRRAPVGTHVVYLGDGVVVKLFAPPWPADFVAERDMLAHVAGRLPVATPKIVASGELEGWPYLVLTRLPGRRLAEIWDELSVDARCDLLERIGALAASLNALPVPGDPAAAASGWETFIAARVENLAAKHRADGLPDAWIADIERFVAGLPPLREWAPDVACLHTDLQAEHVMVDDDLELCGVFDFGDAMIGAREHELVAPIAFVTLNVPGGTSAFLRGYGIDDAQRDPALARRLTAHLVLQRYCALPALLRRLADPAPPVDLAALAARLWDF